MNYWHTQKHGWSQNNYVKWKKPDILFIENSGKCEINLQWQK